MLTAHPYLNNRGLKALDDRVKLDIEAWKLLDLIVQEFKTDPLSTQCFDTSIVKRAIKAVEENKKLIF